MKCRCSAGLSKTDLVLAAHEGDKMVSVKIPQFVMPEGRTFDR